HIVHFGAGDLDLQFHATTDVIRLTIWLFPSVGEVDICFHQIIHPTSLRSITVAAAKKMAKKAASASRSG
ncbi:MAG: hypothetical protein CG440_393, partial [Methanosaeta sp. NSM2]